jgi:hypothetical protein
MPMEDFRLPTQNLDEMTRVLKTRCVFSLLERVSISDKYIAS